METLSDCSQETAQNIYDTLVEAEDEEVEELREMMLRSLQAPFFDPRKPRREAFLMWSIARIRDANLPDPKGVLRRSLTNFLTDVVSYTAGEKEYIHGSNILFEMRFGVKGSIHLHPDNPYTDEVFSVDVKLSNLGEGSVGEMRSAMNFQEDILEVAEEIDGMASRIKEWQDEE